MNLFETIRNWFINGETVTVNASTKADMVEFDWNLESGTFESLESKVIRLREEGKTQEQIAKEIGKTVNQVKGILYGLLGEEKISRKKKYAPRSHVEIVAEINFRPSKNTVTGKETDYFKKWNVDKEAFINHYPYHTNTETGKVFGIDRRYCSVLAKQVGIMKKPGVTYRKLSNTKVKTKSLSSRNKK